MANLKIYLLVATIIAHLTLGTIVITNNSKGLPNRLMLSFSLIVALWSLSVLIVTLHNDYHTILFWIRASHAFGILAPWHIFALAMSLFHDNPFSNRLIRISLIISILFAFLAFTPFFIVDIREPFLAKEIIYGFLTLPFVLFLFIISVLSINQLYKKLKVSRGVVKIQLNYFITGTVVAALLTVSANVILPLLGITYLGQVDIRALGPVFSLVMIGTISYAIIKYRFMDIRFALRKNVTTTVTALSLALIAVLLVRVLFRWDFVENPLAAEILVALIVFFVVLGLPVIRKRLQFLFDNILFKKTEDYYSYLTMRARNLQNVLELDRLLDTLTSDIVASINLEHGFYSLLKNSSDFKVSVIKANPGNEINAVDLGASDDLSESLKEIIDYVTSEKEIIVRSELIRKESSEEALLLDYHLKKLKIELMVPLIVNNIVKGVLFLGAKQSGEPFYREDINLFTMISSQVTATLINAQLYQEILDIKQYQEKILANMGNGLIAIDEDERITIFNSEAEKYTGISSEKALSSKAADILSLDLYEIFKQSLDVNQGQSEVEIKIQVGSETKYLSCSTSLVKFSETGHLEVIMVLSNITQIKELENEKSQSQRLISLGEMAAGIAHEIKNPLVSIKTFTELLPNKYGDDDFRFNFSRVVGQEIVRINNLVEELLSFVKKTDLFLETVSLPSLINEVLMILSPQMEKQKILLKRDYHDKINLVNIDRTLIKQAVINLCVNAIQAMPNGGNLKVGLAFAGNNVHGNYEDNANISPGENNNSLAIFIEDDGIGIPEEIRDNIFNPFVTGKKEGVGLGLSICHNIVLAHSGQLKFASSKGKGTRFEMVLPLN